MSGANPSPFAGIQAREPLPDAPEEEISMTLRTLRFLALPLAAAAFSLAAALPAAAASSP